MTERNGKEVLNLDSQNFLCYMINMASLSLFYGFVFRFFLFFRKVIFPDKAMMLVEFSITAL